MKLNQCVIIQYVIDSRFGSHKSVIFHVLTDGMILILENGALTAIANYYEALLTHFVPTRVYIDSGITNILAENTLIKVHPKQYPMTNRLPTSKGEI